jgi:hypothetical protein
MSTLTPTVRTAAGGRTALVLSALLLPVGPAAVAVLRYVLPYDTTDDAIDVVHKAAADPGALSLVVWLGFVAMLTLIPAVLIVAAHTRRGAPRTTFAALLLLVPGYLSMGTLVAGDAGLLFGVRHGVDDAVLADWIGQGHPSFAIAAGLFVIGHVIGTVLLGIAMWGSGLVPRWAAAATIVSQPLHFVAAAVLGDHTLDLAAWGLNAVGFAAVSLVLITHRPARSTAD